VLSYYERQLGYRQKPSCHLWIIREIGGFVTLFSIPEEYEK